MNDNMSILFILLALGVLNGYKEKKIPLSSGEKIIFSPRTLSFLIEKNVLPGVIDIIRKGLELEDLKDFVGQDEFRKEVDSLINDCYNLMNSDVKLIDLDNSSAIISLLTNKENGSTIEISKHTGTGGQLGTGTP